MKKLVTLLSISAAMLLGAQKLSADSVVDFTSTTVDFTNGNWSLGFEFAIANNMTINGLGFYDSRKDGLTESHEVGIWDSWGTLLASTTVTNSDGLDGWFRYSTIANLTLGAGNYTVGAVTGSEEYTWSPTGFTTAPGVTFVADRFTSSSSLVMPTNTNGLEGWFGANVRIATQTRSVPDASATWLMMAGGLGLVAALRRRR